MNEKLKEFAALAGFNLSGEYHCDEYELEMFAELVLQDERKACADLVFKMAQLPEYDNVWLPLHHAQSAIRARGKK
jgi:hypothetical protein